MTEIVIDIEKESCFEFFPVSFVKYIRYILCRAQWSVKEVMLTASWLRKRRIIIDFLEKGATVNNRLGKIHLIHWITHIYICILSYIYINVYKYIYIYIYIYISIYIYIYIFGTWYLIDIYIYIYIYIYREREREREISRRYQQLLFWLFFYWRYVSSSFKKDYVSRQSFWNIFEYFSVFVQTILLNS